MSTDVIVTRNPDQHRYTASTGGGRLAGFIDYQETSALVVLTHTDVDPYVDVLYNAPPSTVGREEPA